MRPAVPGPDDTRGIVDPTLMRSVASLERYPPGEALDGVVDWFWAVAWDLPDGVEHVQQVLTHPGSHLSVGTVDRSGRVLDPPGALVYGVHRRLDERWLAGSGWTVAAKTSGGLGVLTDRPASTLVDREVSMDAALGLRDVAASVASVGGEAERVAGLRRILEEVIARRSPELLDRARDVTAVAGLAEHDRSIVGVEQLARAGGVGVRTLQRSFSWHLGVSPAWVIRRWRIVEAADRATEEEVVWAELAAELGYADQAHLVRDFRAHLGTAPTAYTRSLTPA